MVGNGAHTHCDLSDLNNGQTLQTVDVGYPRLVILACPEQFWTRCHRIHPYPPNRAKQELKVLRQTMEPFGKLAGSTSERQVANDSDFLFECPLIGGVRELQPILTLEGDRRGNSALSHLCGFRHQASKRPITRSIWWLTSSPEMSYKLDARCKCFLSHAPDLIVEYGAGKSWLTYHRTRQLSEAILAGFALTVLKKDLPRTVDLVEALDQRIRGMRASTPDQTIEMFNRTKSHIFSVGHADRSVPSDPLDH